MWQGMGVWGSRYHCVYVCVCVCVFVCVCMCKEAEAHRQDAPGGGGKTPGPNTRPPLTHRLTTRLTN